MLTFGAAPQHSLSFIMIVCMMGERMCLCAHVEVNFVELVLSYLSMGSRDQTQAFWLAHYIHTCTFRVGSTSPHLVS